MKINFTFWTVERSGGVRYSIEVANRLIDKGHDVSITALKIPVSGVSYDFYGKENWVKKGKNFRINKNKRKKYLKTYNGKSERDDFGDLPGFDSL